MENGGISRVDFRFNADEFPQVEVERCFWCGPPTAAKPSVWTERNTYRLTSELHHSIMMEIEPKYRLRHELKEAQAEVERLKGMLAER